MDRVKLLEAFRDFFHYGRKEQLKDSYTTITAVCTTDTNRENINWDAEEFVFNRLFVGPMSPLAPAVASVYLEPEGLIQGSVTAEIRNFYMSIGLALEDVGREPEDCIAYELDACRHLLLMGKELPEADETYNAFIREHMAAWVPEFSRRAIENCGESVAVKEVLVLLSQWLASETYTIGQNKEMA